MMRIPNNVFVVFINVFISSGSQHVHFTPESLESDRDWTPAPANKTDLYDDSLFEPFPKGMQAKSAKTSR